MSKEQDIPFFDQEDVNVVSEIIGQNVIDLRDSWISEDEVARQVLNAVYARLQGKFFGCEPKREGGE